MANQRRKIKGRNDEHVLIRILRFAAIPLIVIILIIIILCMDQQEEGQQGQAPAISSQDGQTAPGEPDEPADPDGTASHPDAEQSPESYSSQAQEPQADSQVMEADPSQYPFQQDAVLELTGLVQAYCEAKEECDPQLLAWVFGIQDWSEEAMNEAKAHMELVKASVKSYENISCYSIQGPEQDSYVIFPYYEIRYRETETLMPAFSWGYAKKDETGRYYMVQETDEAINDYIRKAGDKPEVKAVMAQILARQQEAIASDEVLQKIYGASGGSEVIIGGVGG
ncbi:MAG: hypothetical protein HFG70_06235 [Hungatella sp.]|nr:hypothetical protein [Hungatella sp.]